MQKEQVKEQVTANQGRDKLVELDQLNALKAALNSSFIANMMVGLLLAVVLTSLFSWKPVLLWLCGLLLVQRYRRFLRAVQTLFAHVNLFPAVVEKISAKRFKVDSLLLAGFWGATGLWFFDGERQSVQFAVAHALGGVSLVSLGVHAYHPRILRWFLLIVNLPFILRCIFQFDLHHEYVGGGMLLMSFYLMLFGGHLSKIVRRAIELRHDNADLVTELKSQTQQLQSANEAKSRFLAAASHDLRQPVHAVGLLAAAVEAREVDASQKDLLHKLQAGLQLFSDVVDEILDIARLDAGGVPVNLQAVSLAQLLQRVDATFYELAAAKGLALIIRAPNDSLACVWGDPALLWRVLSNLVSNAIQYTDKGAVLVAVRRCRTSNEGTAAWRIEVRDTGQGIEPEKQAKVFEEFFQVNNLQRDSQQGLGLGLAVAQRMATLMGARLGLRSRVGIGSVFSVTVHKADSSNTSDSASPQSELSLPTTILNHLNILVIDDDENGRNALQSLMVGWHAEVHVVSGPAQARALIQIGFMPNVLITDHWLGDGHNALTAAEEVRKALMACGQPMPAVAVFTGDIDLAIRHQVQSLGWHFATKPVRPDDLLAWLNSQAVGLKTAKTILN